MTIRLKSAAAVAALSLSLTSAALAQQTAEEGDAPAATDGGQTTSGMGMQGGMGPGMMRGAMKGGRGGGGMGPGAMMMMFVLMDADGDEALSLEEVLSVHERMFNYIDADDDGSVTMEEARAFMQKMHRPMR
ncbi:MAG TPA: EF-hand domain-containing protein [Thermohalobaculum sp.]|nr:EF-hand domain-containing protein [Thermohalobaculum sp.]